MYNIAICDDDVRFAENFKQSFLEKIQEKEAGVEIYISKKGEELLNLYKTNRIDVVFLDIDMPDQDGFQLARIINRKYENSIIIFCSNHNELVYDSFEFQPFWFLCKEQYEKRLDGVLERLIEKMKTEDDEFIIKNKEEILRIKYKDIVYVEVYKHKLQVHCLEESIECRGNLSDIEPQFLGKEFVKINNGCMVNMYHIYKIQNNQLILNTKEVLAISRSRKTNVKDTFFEYLERK